MENTNPEKSLFDISFDENVKQSIKGAAVWGGIAAIVSLAGSILGVINYFVSQGKTSRYTGYEQTSAASASALITIIISFLIGVALFVFLSKFSRKAKSGVDASDQYLINEGLGSLATYFKFIGVLLIIAIVFVLLAVLAGLGRTA